MGISEKLDKAKKDLKDLQLEFVELEVALLRKKAEVAQKEYEFLKLQAEAE